MLPKEKYRLLCEKESSISIFSQAWWLDTVCGEDNWDAAIVEKGNEITAAIPYSFKKAKWGIKTIDHPILTPRIAVFLKYPHNLEEHNRIPFERKLLKQLIKLIPEVGRVRLNLDSKFTNWLPFYWNGYSQTTRYTYIVNDISDHDNLFNTFRSNIRGDIRKAKKSIEVIKDGTIESFYEVSKLTFERQKMQIPYSLSFIKNLHTECQKRGACQIYLAKDNQGKIHAVIYMVWDKETAYYLMGGGDPQLRNSGATSLLMFEAMKDLSSHVQKFDFEGSMIEPIERFFSSFGTVQQPYFRVEKTYSKLLFLLDFLKNAPCRIKRR
jgi:lipid II:glycine glycyltransferase (peptidoglycan interpeptide bridge formation enzyme)